MIRAFFIFTLGVCAAVHAAAAELGHVEGRVVSRLEGRKLLPVEKGHALAADEALISGDASRFELKVGGGGLWRVGRRALFVPREDGAKLLAGTAIVQVPANTRWQVASRKSVLSLPSGTWLVQAVDNGGFKVVCIDASAEVRALGAPGQADKDAAPAPPVVLKLKPGELSFLQPGGKSFSPLVTIFLDEMLGTSRLIAGFPDELPGWRRITNQAIAQRERLKSLSNAVVAGAPKAGSFQIAVPNEHAPEKEPGKDLK